MATKTTKSELAQSLAITLEDLQRAQAKIAKLEEQVAFYSGLVKSRIQADSLAQINAEGKKASVEVRAFGTGYEVWAIDSATPWKVDTFADIHGAADLIRCFVSDNVEQVG